MNNMNLNYKVALFSCILIIVLGFSVYANSLRGGFLWDDRFLVEENSLIRDWNNLGKVFTSPLTPDFHQCYRPLVNASLTVDYHIWKLRPFGYHLTNVLIHLFNACLVYFLIYLLSKDQRISLASGLIFSVHTILTEPVNYISSRADLLVAAFFILSLIFYLKYRFSESKNKLYYIFALVSFILSLLSKELAIILPVVIIVYDAMFIRKEGRANKPAASYLPFFVILAVYGSLRLTILNFPATGVFIPGKTIASLSFIQRFFTSLSVIPLNLRLLFLPLGLHKSWLIKPIGSVFELSVILSVILIIVIFIALKILYARSKLAVFGAVWCFLMFVPHMNIYPLNAFVNEGWFYLPSAGFILCLSSICVGSLSYRNSFNRIVLSVLLITAVSFYSLLTISRNKAWSSDAATFYQDVLRYNPYEDRIHNVLGNVYFNQGKLDEALAEYKISLELNSINPSTYYNIGNVYYAQGRLPEAIVEFNKALDLSPQYIEAHNNLGLAYYKQNNLDMAEQEFKKALQISARHYQSIFNLGNVYFSRGNYPQAEIEYKKAIDVDYNSAQAHHNLGNVFSREKKIDLAIAEFKKAIELDPKRVTAYNDLGSAYFEQGNPDQAIIEYKKALKLNPNYADVYYNLGIIYYSKKQYAESKSNLREAIDLFSRQNNQALKQEAQRLLDQIP